MAAPTITRTAWTDDDGTGTTGTVINNAAKTSIYDQVDALAATLYTVPGGGTGVGTLTAHGVVIGQGTSAVAVTGAGTSGQVLTSNGASADPTFQAAGIIPNPIVQDLLFTDATYDIGKTGATRPRDGFFSRNLSAGGYGAFGGANTTSASAGDVVLLNNSAVRSANAAATATAKLLFADANNVTNLKGFVITVANNATATIAGGTQTGRLYIADANGGSGFWCEVLWTGAAASITYQSGSRYTTTSGNATTDNVYGSAGSCILENKTGSSTTFNVIYIGG